MGERDSGPALLTDRYELTMLASWIREGKESVPAVFEAFARRLPKGRQYGVVAGTGRILDELEHFRFDADEIEWLLEDGIVDPATAEYLERFDLSDITIDGYREGELYFPNSPILTVAGPLGKCCVLETLVLSALNHDCAVASAASRMVLAARGRPIIEMGSRRTHEQSAVAAARAAYIAGFASTSNLAAGRRYAIPTRGTAAHAFTLSHPTEEAAFRAQVEAHGPSTTLLVDTYDIAEGIRTAVRVAGTDLGAIRLDSGDPAEESRKARALLDELGATSTRVTVTSDMDEYTIEALADAPVDGFGVGTRVVTGSGHPAAGMVYKLVAIADGADSTYRPVQKLAAGKASYGGRKLAFRELDSNGHISRERVVIRHVEDDREGFPGRRLQRRLWDGKRVDDSTVEDARRHHAAVLNELMPYNRTVTNGEPATVVTL